MKLQPSRRVLCTPYNHAPCHFMQSYIRKVYACLAVTCHLHFWQNDRGLLRAAAVKRGWNRYRNKSQYRKSTLEKKILPPLLPRFEPATFQSQLNDSLRDVSTLHLGKVTYSSRRSSATQSCQNALCFVITYCGATGKPLRDKVERIWAFPSA